MLGIKSSRPDSFRRTELAPGWTCTQTQPFKKIEGEVGVFTGTVLNDGIANAMFLKMELAGEPYMGFLSCNDPGFCRQLHDMLQNYIGRTIREIGNLDLGFTS